MDGSGGGGIVICYSSSGTPEVNIVANGGNSANVSGAVGGAGGRGTAFKINIVGGDGLILK